ncbi:hypothetical protein HG1285_10993, partial [Hydrogenivirga sp. 128-5-R1-1]
AVISNASRKNQKVIVGKFKDIEKLSKKAEKPAVIVFGEVVNLHNKLPNYKNVILEIKTGEKEWISL